MSGREIIVKEQSLLQISWPIFIELALHMGAGIIATLMLGHYSDDAAAGVGVANQLLNIFILVFNVTSIGATILISQSIGAKDVKRSKRLARSSFGINFWFGLIIGIFLLFFGGRLLNLFDINGMVYEYGLIFIRICGVSLFLESISLALSATLRSYGFTKEAMFVTFLMDVICVIGNSLSIYGLFGLPITGVYGVAFTIVVARIFVVVSLIILVYKKISMKVSIKDIFRIKMDDVRDLFEIGIPSAGENLSYQFSQLVITGFIASMGDASLSARVYIMNISMVCYLFTIAIAQGTQLLLGRYIGSRNFEKAFRRGISTLRLALLSAVTVSFIIALIGEPILELFTIDTEIIAIGLPILWVIVFVEPGRAMNIVLMGSLKAAGDVKFPVVIGLISMWSIAVLFSYILGVHFGLGLLGVWIAQGMDEWFRGIFAIRRWYKRPWERKYGVEVMK